MSVWAQVVWGRVTDWTDSFCEIGLPLYGLLLRARALGSPQSVWQKTLEQCKTWVNVTAQFLIIDPGIALIVYRCCLKRIARELFYSPMVIQARTAGPNQIPFEVDSWTQALTEDPSRACKRRGRTWWWDCKKTLAPSVYDRSVTCC